MKLAVIFLLAATNAYAGSVQCTCPTVSAKGTGDTSCSATESGGTCTVDFNTFTMEDEQAALKLLAASARTDIAYRFLDRNEFRGGMNSQTARMIAANDPRNLVDLLTIYILVSGVQTDLSLGSDSLASLHAALRKDAGEVYAAFVDGGYAEIKFRSGDRALVTLGCIEVYIDQDSYWGMFKSFWAENRGSPQCRREDG